VLNVRLSVCLMTFTVSIATDTHNKQKIRRNLDGWLPRQQSGQTDEQDRETDRHAHHSTHQNNKLLQFNFLESGCRFWEPLQALQRCVICYAAVQQLCVSLETGWTQRAQCMDAVVAVLSCGRISATKTCNLARPSVVGRVAAADRTPPPAVLRPPASLLITYRTPTDRPTEPAYSHGYRRRQRQNYRPTSLRPSV